MRALLVLIVAIGTQSAAPTDAYPEALTTPLAELRDAAERPFDAEAGARLWAQETIADRTCMSCHTDAHDARGRHIKTGKVIEPMARTVNPERLTDVKKMKKWLLRNCKWTFDRECTPGEQGDVLVWLAEF